MKKKMVRRLKEKHTVILGQWGHRPHGPVLPGPEAALTSCPWKVGGEVIGSWGASSLHSETPADPHPPAQL